LENFVDSQSKEQSLKAAGAESGSTIMQIFRERCGPETPSSDSISFIFDEKDEHYPFLRVFRG